MFDYSHIGLNQNLQGSNSLSTRGSTIIGMSFDREYEIQTKRSKTSQSAVRDFWSNSAVGSAVASGPYGNGEWVTLTSTLSAASPFTNRRTFGDPYFTVYEGTSSVGSMKIYPDQGNGIGAGDYKVISGFNPNSPGDGLNSSWQLTVFNVAAGAVSLYFEGYWRYNVEEAGTAT